MPNSNLPYLSPRIVYTFHWSWHVDRSLWMAAYLPKWMASGATTPEYATSCGSLVPWPPATNHCFILK